MLKINNVLLGTYTITETVVPNGYAIGAVATRTIIVSTSDLNAVIGIQGCDQPGDTSESDFHNNKLGTTPPIPPTTPSTKIVAHELVWESLTTVRGLSSTNRACLQAAFASEPSVHDLVLFADDEQAATDLAMESAFTGDSWHSSAI